MPSDIGKLVLASFTLRDFGLFDPATLIYKRTILNPSGKVSPKAEYRLWKDSEGNIFLNIQNYGILRYNKKDNSFTDDKPFPFPPNWTVSLLGAYENVKKQQYWFACDSGMCIYDKRSRQMWSRENNPTHLAILNNRKDLACCFSIVGLTDVNTNIA